MTALAMPVVTALAAGGLLDGTHHTSLGHYTPPVTSSPSATTQLDAQDCIKNIQTPFTGIAVNTVSSGAVQQFNDLTRSHVGIIEFYNTFPGKFDKAAANSAVNLGDVPFIQLNPGKLDPRVIRQIASGADNTQIKNYARSVRNFGYCVIISFGHEMNGWWYRWGEPWNTPRTFIRAWRRMHDIFHSMRVKNVIWSWDPSHQYGVVTTGKVATPAGKWYPDKSYVDWVGIDGYLSKDGSGGLQNFKEVFGHQIAYVRKAAPGKPIFIAETGVAPTVGSGDIAQINEIFRNISQDQLTGLIWFEQDRKQPWALTAERKPAAQAYHQGVANYPAPVDVENAANLR